MEDSVKAEIISNLDKLDDKKLEQINDIIKAYIYHQEIKPNSRVKYLTSEEKQLMKLQKSRESYWRLRTPEKLEQRRIKEYNRRHGITES